MKFWIVLVLSSKWYCDGIRAFIFMEEKIQDKTSSSTRRIAKNTLMLYFRQILIMVVSLYTVRVVLNTLGAEDYEE